MLLDEVANLGVVEPLVDFDVQFPGAGLEADDEGAVLDGLDVGVSI